MIGTGIRWQCGALLSLLLGPVQPAGASDRADPVDQETWARGERVFSASLGD